MAPEQDCPKLPFRIENTTNSALNAFQNFLFDFEERIKRDKEFEYDDVERKGPAILDAVEAWLVYGNAVKECGTFVNYLVTVVSIVAMWADRNYRDEDGSGDFLFQDAMNLFDEDAPVSRCGYLTWLHPALSRTAWEIAAATTISGLLD